MREGCQTINDDMIVTMKKKKMKKKSRYHTLRVRRVNAENCEEKRIAKKKP